MEQDVAIKGYEDGLRTLFLAGAGLAAVTVIVQAGTGWQGAKEEDSVLEEERDALVRRQDDEEGGQ